MPPADWVVLPDDYYLINFRTLVRFVGQLYDDLLLADERRWLQAVESLGEPAARLYVRLVCRRGSVFRLGKLRYAEIADIEAASAEIAAAGLALRHAPATMRALLGHFSKAELLSLSERQDLAGCQRADLDASLLRAADRGLSERLTTADRWLAVRGQDYLARFMLCYFGNARQTLSDFVLRDLGTLRFTPYRLDASCRAFATRAQLDAHWQVHAASQACEQIDSGDAEALKTLAGVLPAPDPEDAVLCRRVDRLLLRLARQLERLGDNRGALELYGRARLPPARERRVRLLHVSGHTREALALCRDMRRSALHEQELYFAHAMESKLRRALGEAVPAARRFRPYTTTLTLRRQDGRVEAVSAAFFSRFGECHYVENSLVTGVFGLFIWDILFAPIPGAFYNPFQTGPADFYEPDFSRLRASLLERRFAELDTDRHWQSRVLGNFSRHHGLLNPLVHWSALSIPLLERALERIPATHWRALFARVLADPRHNASGLPDLVLFAVDGGYEFIEIKGPGDALQANQRRWMRYFAEHAIPYRMVQVRWAPRQGAGRAVRAADCGAFSGR